MNMLKPAIYISTDLCMFFQTIKIFGGIDILVSNAATNPTSGSVLDVRLCLYSF